MSEKPKSEDEAPGVEVSDSNEPLVVDETTWEEDPEEGGDSTSGGQGASQGAPPASADEEARSDVPILEARDTEAPISDPPDTVPATDSARARAKSADHDSDSAPPSPWSLVAAHDVDEEPPLDEELSESLRPLPPPLPSERPSQRPTPMVAPPGAPEWRAAVPASPPRAQKVGTGIWYAGVFLWAYVVVGEYVIGAGLPEFLGWSLFVGVVVGTFLQGANRIGTEVMRKVALTSLGATGAALFFLVTIVGSPGRSTYQTVSALLLLASVVAIFYGLRHARRESPLGESGPRMTWGRVAMGLFFGGNTLLILVALLFQI